MDEKYNIPYIEKHTRRAEAAFAQNQSNIAINSLWRIASNTEIFGEELDPKGNLTPEQIEKVKGFILSLNLNLHYLSSSIGNIEDVIGTMLL